MRPFIAAIVLLTGSSPAWAHRLHVKPTLVGDQLRVEAYYDDDTPAQEAQVTILMGDDVVAAGRTDEKGVWTGARPQPGTYIVKAESVGHAAKESLVIAEIKSPPDESPADVRKQRTQIPWARLAMGLGMIGGLYVAYLIARRALWKAATSISM
ncbi:MAG TPA: hypothetical protein VHR66_28670 [Gemmataceae bacterium]|jgi:hypothetical protein|nr:hypothetical protein [Gemmataceae bacterium]